MQACFSRNVSNSPQYVALIQRMSLRPSIQMVQRPNLLLIPISSLTLGEVILRLDRLDEEWETPNQTVRERLAQRLRYLLDNSRE